MNTWAWEISWDTFEIFIPHWFVSWNLHMSSLRNHEIPAWVHCVRKNLVLQHCSVSCLSNILIRANYDAALASVRINSLHKSSDLDPQHCIVSCLSNILIRANYDDGLASVRINSLHKNSDLNSQHCIVSCLSNILIRANYDAGLASVRINSLHKNSGSFTEDEHVLKINNKTMNALNVKW